MKKLFLVLVLIYQINLTFSQVFDSNINLITDSYVGVPEKVVSFDFDNDGDNDIFTIGNYISNSPPTLLYFENLGSGNFSNAIEVTSTNITGGSSLVIGDLNGDGLKDLCVRTPTFNNIIILLNGDFNVIIPNSQINHIKEIKDYDGDGIDEFVTSKITAYKVKVEVLKYNFTTDSFTTVTSMLSSNAGSTSSGNVTATKMIDFDNDGDMDFITTHQTNGYIFFKNIGNNTFDSGTGIPTLTVDLLPSYDHMYLYDINGDNLLDVILYKYVPTSIYYFENTGNSSFNPVVTINVNTQEITGLSFTDMDNDNNIEIMCANNISTAYNADIDFYEFQNNSFTSIPTNSLNGYNHIFNSIILDINNDNKPDLVSTLEYKIIGWYENINNFIFNDTIKIINSLKNNSVMAFDFDNDGDNDVFTSPNIFAQNYFMYCKNQQNGTFNKQEYTISPYFNNIITDRMEYGDYDGDGYKDVFLHFYNSSIFLLKNNAGNDFEYYINLNAGSTIIDYDIYDLDTNNFVDLIVVSNDRILWRKNINGNFNSSNVLVYLPNERQNKIHCIDADNDGDIDIFTGGSFPYTSTGTKLFYHENTGNNNFISHVFFTDNSIDLIDFNVGDFNNDGNIDVSLLTNNNLSYFYYQGGGTFSNVSNLNNQITNPNHCYVKDINHDNYSDIVLQVNHNQFYFYESNTNGFTLLDSITLQSLPSLVDFTDMDNDNVLDLIEPGENVKWHKNISCIDNTIDSVYACFSYTWIDGITYYSSTNTPTYTLTNIYGCDSIVTLNLSIFNSNINTDYQTTCGPYTWIDGIEYNNSNNTATYSPYPGCEFNLDLVVYSPSYSTDIQYACNSFTWIDGNTYTSSTNTPTYTFVNGAANGCDSTVTLDLHINPTTQYTTDTQYACESTGYTWVNGITYYNSISGPTYYYQNIYGCDSIVTLDLTIYPIYSNEEHIFVCYGDSYTFLDGDTYNNITEFFTKGINFTTINGCDSLIMYWVHVEGNHYYDTINLCKGDSYTFPDGTTQTNIQSDLDYISSFTTVGSGCDSIIYTNIDVLDVSSNLIADFSDPNTITLNANFPNPDTILWIECNSPSDTIYIFNNYGDIIPAPYPGDFSAIIINSGCIDTTDCVTISSQDFHNLASYVPLFGEVFAYPVTAIGNCDTIAEAYINGGFPPYTYDWYTQVNNENTDVLDSICEGFHMLKVIDLIGDSVLVDYYVTDTANWYVWLDTASFYVDTIYLAIENCNIDINSPLDSANVLFTNYLYSGNQVNEDYYLIAIEYYQFGNGYIYQDTVLMQYGGYYLIDFSVFCPNKSTSRIKTMLLSTHHSGLGLKENNIENIISIYPNPSNGFINISSKINLKDAMITVLDLTGKEVLTLNYSSLKNQSIDLNNLSDGIYFIKIKNMYYSVSKKIVVEK